MRTSLDSLESRLRMYLIVRSPKSHMYIGRVPSLIDLTRMQYALHRRLQDLIVLLSEHAQKTTRN